MTQGDNRITLSINDEYDAVKCRKHQGKRDISDLLRLMILERLRNSSFEKIILRQNSHNFSCQN
jgi:hypothetical protein